MFVHPSEKGPTDLRGPCLPLASHVKTGHLGDTNLSSLLKFSLFDSNSRNFIFSDGLENFSLRAYGVD